jgi:hypothetical protein
MKRYFQTWMYVSKLRRWGLPTFVRLIQFLCGLRGHELSKTEWGYGGGEYADRWCRWCNKLIIVPKDSIRFAFKENAHLMDNLGKEYHEQKTNF